MTKQHRLRSMLDFAGTVGLITAATALIGEQWLHVATEGALFVPFFYSFAAGFGCLVTARLLQITQVVINNPDSRRHRAHVLVSASTVESIRGNSETSKEAAELQRAA